MNGDKKKINIYELAEETGYSTSTVSKALNNTGRIGKETRQKILDRARELNYIPSYHAKALSLKESWIIAVIYTDNLGVGLAHPHFSVILENFKREVEKAGYEVTFVNRNMGKTPMTYLEFCHYRKVDGVFIVNFYSLSHQLPELIESGIPIVTADEGNLEITTIVSDDLQGGRLASEYLFELGHNKKVYHIAGPQYTVSAQKRLQGFTEVMNEKKVPECKVYNTENFGFEDGYNTALEIIKDDDLPTAIFVAGDWMALGAIKAFHEHSIKVPEDVSIIGYDDMEFLKYSIPALTTVSQNKSQIGITSAQYLLDKIAGEDRESTTIDVSIVERDTCKRIN